MPRLCNASFMQFNANLICRNAPSMIWHWHTIFMLYHIYLLQYMWNVWNMWNFLQAFYFFCFTMRLGNWNWCRCNIILWLAMPILLKQHHSILCNSYMRDSSYSWSAIIMFYSIYLYHLYHSARRPGTTQYCRSNKLKGGHTTTKTPKIKIKENMHTKRERKKYWHTPNTRGTG